MSEEENSVDDDTAGWYIAAYNDTLEFAPQINPNNGEPEVYRTQEDAEVAAFRTVRRGIDGDPELVEAHFDAPERRAKLKSIIVDHDGKPMLAVGRVRFSP